MANLKQLAQSLGLSITTVSRALDGYGDVSATTRERVRQAAKQAGYHPNAAARRLRKQRAELVAVTLPSEPGHIGPAHFLEMLSGCAEHLAAAGLNLVIAPVPSGESELDMCRRFVDGQRVDAMLLVRTKRHDERVEFLQSRGIPFVTNGRTESTIQHAFIDGDGLSGFRRATLRFYDAGHRRIGHIAGPQAYFFAHERKKGWEAAMNDCALPTDLCIEQAPTEQGGYEAALELLNRPDRPTALVCATDEMAIGALRALREVDGGDLISLIGHDDLPIGAFTSPSLSTMRMTGGNLGHSFASLLLRTIAGEPPETLQELHAIEFVDRDSHHRSSPVA
ncbi:substrate-binding domain-containing protein [Phyllobacterium sp. 0TCS1.6C]|uniref:LacI family DNA-binding transcriptional regulator n=1 Tax=unclassified Phyllobacterium TaxID=2638441 RepID=UPI0022647657|nr:MULTISPECIES: substrate-binding domain-containing protein [unclassified Phyllobacterium]MCX8278856.1 substrate-binding domain-containing protein [Phyllobacterium sp. 0TCS1.6C]MCX8293640.1 substrate-binding domain-containing protein [Phyllobacterium sp. 0TCS1.6A]